MSCISHVEYLGQNLALLRIDNVKFREVLTHKELMEYIFNVMIQVPVAINTLLGWHKKSDMEIIIEFGEVYTCIGGTTRLIECTQEAGWVNWWADGRMGWMGGLD